MDYVYNRSETCDYGQCRVGQERCPGYIYINSEIYQDILKKKERSIDVAGEQVSWQLNLEMLDIFLSIADNKLNKLRKNI